MALAATLLLPTCCTRFHRNKGVIEELCTIAEIQLGTLEGCGRVFPCISSIVCHYVFTCPSHFHGEICWIGTLVADKT